MPRFFRELVFMPTIAEIVPEEPKGKLVVLTGGNTSGKSAYLKTTVNDPKKLYIGVNRFYSFHHVPPYTKNDNEISQWYSQTVSQTQNSEFHNFENSFFNCATAISRLSNSRRSVLFQLFTELFNIPIEVKPEDPDNEFSNRFVSVDGDSLSVTSSGTRLFLGILAALMDDRFSTVAIDEPELGLTPNLQRRLADIIIRGLRRDELFAHDPNILLSTHSHIFLDKAQPRNNYVVTREGEHISASVCTSFQQLNEIQFRLLGNDLGELFLPDAVIFVEGETDKIYLEKVLSICLPKAKIIVQQCNGDIAKRLTYWSETLGDMQLSPYRYRTFIVYDRVRQAGIERACSAAGLPKASMIEWNGNGIEFIYPVELLSQIFKADITDTSALTISGDIVSKDQISYKKMSLCKLICEKTDEKTPISPELKQKLIVPLTEVVS